MKKLNKNIKGSLVLMASVLLLTVSCKESLDELFLHPEKSTETKIEYHFTTNLLRGFFRLNQMDAWNFAFNAPNAYSDINARNSNDGVDEISSPTRADNLWGSYYTSEMAPISEMNLIFQKLTAEDQADYQVYMELAKICAAFNTHHLTDVIGDMPYSEAFKSRALGAEQILFPKYDTQESVYDAMLKDLKDASNALKSTVLGDNLVHNSLATQDLIFGGDLVKWQKFANSLRLRLAMRISDVDPGKAESIVKEIISGYPLITSNDDNVIFESNDPDGLNLPAGGLSNRGYRDGYSSGNTFASNTMMDIMVPSNDPRLPVLFQPNAVGDYVGVPNSPDLQAAWELENGSVNEENVAILNQTTFEENEKVPGVSISAAEVSFLKAEAIMKGWITGNAQTEYENGIRQSIEFYYWIRNLNPVAPAVELPDEAAINAFLATDQVAFDINNGLKQIWTQKWIHTGTFFPFESWAEFRRTDTPEVPDYLVNGHVIARPVRFLYPSNEFSFNLENYQKVSDKDGFYDRIWWDVK